MTDTPKLTVKQEAFATAVAKGENASDAYRAEEGRRLVRKTLS